MAPATTHEAGNGNSYQTNLIGTDHFCFEMHQLVHGSWLILISRCASHELPFSLLSVPFLLLSYLRRLLILTPLSPQSLWEEESSKCANKCHPDW